jgi:hypothetical protein
MMNILEYLPGSHGTYRCVACLDCDCHSFFLFGPTRQRSVGPLFY